MKIERRDWGACRRGGIFALGWVGLERYGIWADGIRDENRCRVGGGDGVEMGVDAKARVGGRL